MTCTDPDTNQPVTSADFGWNWQGKDISNQISSSIGFISSVTTGWNGFYEGGDANRSHYWENYRKFYIEFTDRTEGLA